MTLCVGRAVTASGEAAAWTRRPTAFVLSLSRGAGPGATWTRVLPRGLRFRHSNAGGERRSQMIWTRNRGLVNAIEGYIIHDFCLAEIRLAIGEQVDELFGPNLLKLREKFFPAV